MTIDMPSITDKPAMRRLWQQAFSDTDDFLNGFFRTGFSPSRCRCLWQGERLAAALYWFDCRWQGRKIAYLYAVATDMDFRRQGLCRALLEDTHRHLQQLGYAGAALVPADAELFGLYGRLGYRGFCAMEKQQIMAADMPEKITSVDAADYARLRRSLLPESSILQEGETLGFLGTYAGFYTGADCVFSAARENETVYFQEFLGDAAALAGIVTALGGTRGVVRLQGGGTDFAMYRSFTRNKTMPAYLGIPLD